MSAILEFSDEAEKILWRLQQDNFCLQLKIASIQKILGQRDFCLASTDLRWIHKIKALKYLECQNAGPMWLVEWIPLKLAFLMSITCKIISIQ